MESILYLNRPGDSRSFAPPNDAICDRCGDPISFNRAIQDLSLTMTLCGCGVRLEYDPDAPETDAPCRVCQALGAPAVMPHEQVDSRAAHVHLVPLAEEARSETLRGVLSHSRYGRILREYEASLEELEKTLDGGEGDWSEIQQVALTLQNAADGLEVLHARSGAADRDP